MNIQLIYASTSGNVETVSKCLTDRLKEQGFSIDLHRAEATKFDIIEANKVFILATSTWEHGELNPFFLPLWKEMQQHDLSGKYAVFVGLGDLRYEPVLFCGGMEQLKKTFLEQGGTEIFTPLRINGEPYQYFDTTIKTWTERLIPNLEQLQHD